MKFGDNRNYKKVTHPTIPDFAMNHNDAEGVVECFDLLK